MATKRRKQRVVVKEPLLASRLADLMRGQSIRAFAADCHVNYRRLSAWLKGRNAPDADNLRRIAAAKGVSVDWLLGLPGAPMLRGQDRAPAELEADVANHVCQILEARYPAPLTENDEPYRWVVRGAAVLEAAVSSVTAGAELEHERQRAHLEALTSAGDLNTVANDLLKRLRRRFDKDTSQRLDRLCALSRGILQRAEALDTRKASAPVLLVPPHIGRRNNS